MLKAIPFWLRLGVVLVLAVSALLWWKVPQWRVEKAMAQVDELVSVRDFQAARERLEVLLDQYPRETEVALRLAGLLRMDEPTEAFSIFEGLHESNRLPLDRYPEAILLGFESGSVEMADAMLEGLESRKPEMARLSGPLAIRALLQGDLVEARNRLDEVLALFPEWSQIRYIRAQFLRRSPSKVDRLKAKEDFLRLIDGDDFDALRALIGLGGSNSLAVSTSEKYEFLGRAIDHPMANPRLRLLAHHLRWRLMPEERESEIAAAMADLADHNPVILAEWMNAIGEHARALELVPDGELALTNPAAFEQRFRALALEGRFGEAESLVQNSDIDETAVQKAARLFLVALRPNNDEEATERWSEAYALARSENDRGVQYFLARSALRLGYLAGAVQAYESLFADEEFASGASEEVWVEYFTVELATGALEEAHQVLVAGMDKYPDSLSLVNNRLYIELIGGMDWRETYGRFVELAPPPEEIRDVNGTGSTWVLASLLRDLPDKALEQMKMIEGTNPDQPISDSTKIVKALVLAANQHYDEALSLAHQIDRNQVLPAEWALLGELRLNP